MNVVTTGETGLARLLENVHGVGTEVHDSTVWFLRLWTSWGQYFSPRMLIQHKCTILTTKTDSCITHTHTLSLSWQKHNTYTFFFFTIYLTACWMYYKANYLHNRNKKWAGIRQINRTITQNFHTHTHTQIVHQLSFLHSFWLIMSSVFPFFSPFSLSVTPTHTR